MAKINIASSVHLFAYYTLAEYESLIASYISAIIIWLGRWLMVDD
jgi:hypothetical protein